MHVACPDLPSALSAGHTIITPTPLLASVAKEQFVRQQLHAGAFSWHPPKIVSVGAWLAECWQQARYSGAGVPTLLSPVQERRVWLDLLESAYPDLFDHSGAVGMAIAASRIVTEWRLPMGDESWSFSSDTRQFRELLRLFQQRAGREGWMVRSDLWDLVGDWVEEPWFGDLWLSTGTLVFAGFPTIPAALGSLLSRLGGKAKTLSIALRPNTKPVPCYECGDQSEELDLAARWLRHQHEKNPKASLALVTADLPSQVSAIERTLSQVFYPSGRSMDDEQPSVFHIHVPERLSDHPLVSGALLLLELGKPRISTADAGTILRSPYLSGALEERSERALADLQLRRDRDLDVSLGELQKASSHCARLQDLWHHIRSVLQERKESAELADWSEFIGHLVTAAGWPGDLDLSASEQQAVDGWSAALDDLSTLGMLRPASDFEHAVTQFRELVDARTLDSGDLTSPVQVLDADTAYGLRFDGAIAVGLSDEHWPPTRRPSPFLPFSLQRPILTWQARQRSEATAALFSTAPTMVCSYSGIKAPAVHAFTKPGSRRPPHWTGHAAGQASVFFHSEEVLDDTEAPSFALTDRAVPGGVSILKSQSQCPFQAFAKYRLSARRPEDACFGFDARDRGSFLHAALENVWRQLRTLDGLQSTNNSARQAIVRDAVARAVGLYTDSPFHELAGQAERERLEKLILEWLRIEETRAQPFAVEHIEKDQFFDIEGLHLNLRIDRVDRLSNGSAVLVDYKSGEPKLKSLEPPRPSEPQLHLYAAAIQERVEGLFFAQLKPRDLKAVGWSRTLQFPKRGPKNTRADWDQFVADADHSVRAIAREFIKGWASVDPQPGACNFCEIKPFCRINEQASLEDSDDAD